MTYIDSNTKIVCFDTTTIYNHIISRINEGMETDNPFNLVKLTLDDIANICYIYSHP
jgi:hypothetical protein